MTAGLNGLTIPCCSKGTIRPNPESKFLAFCLVSDTHGSAARKEEKTPAAEGPSNMKIVSRGLLLLEAV